MVMGRVDADVPLRCFLCTKPVAALLEAEGGPGPVDPPAHNGGDPAQEHNDLLLGLLGLGEDQ
jgi:hypothetical protein